MKPSERHHEGMGRLFKVCYLGGRAKLANEIMGPMYGAGLKKSSLSYSAIYSSADKDVKIDCKLMGILWCGTFFCIGSLKMKNGRVVGSCRATWWGGRLGATPNFEPIFFYTNVI